MKNKRNLITTASILFVLVAVSLFFFIKNKYYSPISADIIPTSVGSCGNMVCDKNESYASCPADCDAISDFAKKPSLRKDMTYANLPLPQGQLIEKDANWKLSCNNYANDYPVVPCPTDTKKTNETVDGKTPLTLSGSKSNEITYFSPLYSAEPNTNYKISADFKITDRLVYNYLDLAYPTDMKSNPMLGWTGGIWGGTYSMAAWSNFAALQPLVGITQPQNHSASYINASETPWFHEEKTINSGTSGTVQLSFDLEGFAGKLHISNLVVEKDDSLIPDAALHIPIESWTSADPNHAPTMKINSVVSSPPISITTNSAKFTFSNDALTTEKGSQQTKIEFSAGYLNNLQVSQKPEEPGIVLVENQNIAFSVGADSTVIAKCKTDCQSTISSSIAGKGKDYHYFAAGVVFATDYKEGIFFTPIKTDSDIYTSPEKVCHHTSPTQVDCYDPIGTAAPETWVQDSWKNKNWEINNWFSDPTWKISYNFKAGSGFLAEAFPPKDFNSSKYCDELMSDPHDELDSPRVNLNTDSGLDPKDDHQAGLKRIKDAVGNSVSPILTLWMNGYAVTKNDLDPPKTYTYYTGSDNNKYFKDSSGKYWPPLPAGVTITKSTETPTFGVDVAGPYIVEKRAALQKFVRQAHSNGEKITLYMSPYFYYTSNVDRFLANLKTLLADDNPTTTADGVYFDGLYYLQPLKSLELVRKTRNLLKDKIYLQHNSWTASVIGKSYKFRVPVLDAYADELLVGEALDAADDNTWKLNYCGKNVSNTITNLYAVNRPGPPPSSLPNSTQAANSLSCNGKLQTRAPDVINSANPAIVALYPTNLSYFANVFWKDYKKQCKISPTQK